MGLHQWAQRPTQWHSTIRLADDAHGLGSKALTRLCQAVLPAVAVLHITGAVDMDSLVASLWQEIYSWQATHMAMIEALVAAFAFVAWISLFLDFERNAFHQALPHRGSCRDASNQLPLHECDNIQQSLCIVPSVRWVRVATPLRQVRAYRPERTTNSFPSVWGVGVRHRRL